MKPTTLWLSILMMVISVGYAQGASKSQIVQMIQQLPGKIARHRISINKCTTPPVLDGNLDEPAWKHAALLTNFVHAETGVDEVIPGLDAIEAESLIYVTYDDTHLYIAARMMEPMMKYIVSASENRDDPAWTDDSLEWFFDTDMTGKQVIQLIANNEGVIWDGHDNDGKANVSWTCEGFRVGTRHGTDSWYLEWAVPYEGLGVNPPKKGDIWRVQFARQRYTSPTGSRIENGTWVGSPDRSFKVPAWFGEILFGDVATTQAQMPQATFGKQEATIAFYNARPIDLPLTFYTASTGQTHQSQTTSGIVPAGQTRSFKIPILTEDEGAHINALQVYSGTELLSVVRRTYYIEPLSKPMQEKLDYALMLSKAESQSKVYRENMLKRALEMQSQLNKLGDIKKELIHGNLSEIEKYERWEKVAEDLNAIDIPSPPAKPKLSIWQ